MRTTGEENLHFMLQQKHSRVPIYREEKDHILGIVHLKDVFLHQDALRQGRETLNPSLAALFVPDTLSTDEMLFKFQKSKQHMAVLVDEFGGVAGIVTLNDLISEIVGEIHDEHDEDAGDYQIIDDTEVMLKGSMPVSDLNRVFDLDIQPENADTVAGYIIERWVTSPADRAGVVTSERYSSPWWRLPAPH